DISSNLWMFMTVMCAHMLSVFGQTSRENNVLLNLLRTKRSSDCDNNNCFNSIARNSICPWHYRINFNEYRRPRSIPEAICESDSPRILPTHGLSCLPISAQIHVKQLVLNGHFQWRNIDIRVGCTAVLQ
ncbi:Hypothetical predicted protein, partial [Mytilus galloprovincialis]